MDDAQAKTLGGVGRQFYRPIKKEVDGG